MPWLEADYEPIAFSKIRNERFEILSGDAPDSDSRLPHKAQISEEWQKKKQDWHILVQVISGTPQLSMQPWVVPVSMASVFIKLSRFVVTRATTDWELWYWQNVLKLAIVGCKYLSSRFRFPGTRILWSPGAFKNVCSPEDETDQRYPGWLSDRPMCVWRMGVSFPTDSMFRSPEMHTN